LVVNLIPLGALTKESNCTGQGSHLHDGLADGLPSDEQELDAARAALRHRLVACTVHVAVNSS
jgi:hypothetical protein